MSVPGADLDEDSIGALFGRLVDDAGRFVRAELDLYREAAIHRVTASRSAMVMAVAAILLIQGGMITLLIGLAFGLARFIGPVGGAAVVALAALLAAFLLGRAAARRFARIATWTTDTDID